MGASLVCINCNQQFTKPQFVLHQIHCRQQMNNNNKPTTCNICSKTMHLSEYYDHVLSHYKDDTQKESFKNPSVTFCDYNFSSKKIQRVTRIGENLQYFNKIDRKDYSNIVLSKYLSNSRQRKKGLVPVEEELLKIMPTRNITKDEELTDKTCSICMKDYEINDILLTTPCSHYYHIECIHGWFRKNNNCPICKFKIVKENISYKSVKESTGK